MKIAETLLLDQDRHPDWVLDMVSNSDETSLAVTSGSKMLSFHDAGTLKQVSSVCGAHSSRINCIESSRSNPHLVMTCSEDKLVKYWDARSSHASGSVLQFRFADEVQSASMGTKDSLLAAATKNSLKFADTRKTHEARGSSCADGKMLTEVFGEYGDVHMDDITVVRFHPERTNEVFTASEDGLIACYDTSVSEHSSAVLSIINTDCPVRTFGFYGPNREGLFSLSTVETASFWHIYSALRLSVIPRVRETHAVHYLVDCFAVGDDLQLLAGTNSGEGTLLSVTPAQMKIERAVRGGHTEVIRAASYLSRSGRLITGGEDAKICQFEHCVQHTSTNGT